MRGRGQRRGHRRPRNYDPDQTQVIQVYSSSKPQNFAQTYAEPDSQDEWEDEPDQGTWGSTPQPMETW